MYQMIQHNVRLRYNADHYDVMMYEEYQPRV